ncbi:MAG: ParB N-terminal domain-containing protein [candidate division Zixibacteria bacterium]|nr:ParB N-terminal domain-containing protein [candidate division Zixibacteria bacterium]
MKVTRVPLDLLFADRQRISFRNIPPHAHGEKYYELVNTSKSRVPIAPIQVTTQGTYYVIRYGYRRALAALETGRRYIDAYVEKDKKPICQMVPIKDLMFPQAK